MARSGDDGFDIETALCQSCRSHEQSFAQIPYEWLGPAGRLLRDDPLYAAECDPVGAVAIFSVIAGELTDEHPTRTHQLPLMMGLDTFRFDNDG